MTEVGMGAERVRGGGGGRDLVRGAPSPPARTVPGRIAGPLSPPRASGRMCGASGGER